MKTNPLRIPLAIGRLLLFAMLAAALPAWAQQKSEPIPFSQLGAKATADYHGDALAVEATPEGARLRTGFQKLAGTVTRAGLALDSTAEGAGRLRLSASALGREGALVALPATGAVQVQEKTVRWVRSGVTEEYSVSVDGLRQDFVVSAADQSDLSPLIVELALSGARAEAAADGVKLTLDGSGRALAYAKLHVSDATGRVLPAHMEVAAEQRLRVVVEDAGAVYPVRIDPTFSDADWVSLNSGIPGANHDITATAVDASGNLYVGGGFTFIGTVAANRIAKWNGSTWSALGTGMDDTVYALAFDASGNLHAGGQFSMAGGIAATRIAKWNGSAWSALGTGMNNPVFALAFDASGNLYAGGDFTTAGGVPNTGQIAKWNGSAWSAVGTGGGGGTVYALALDASGNLYAGGFFPSMGGTPANNIAKWNGSAWSALGTGTSEKVYALAVDAGGNLYAGGFFHTMGGAPNTNRIAKWNGSAWSALGTGMDDTVYALAFDASGNLHAGGPFTTAGGTSANSIAKWDGSTWSAFGSGMNNRVSALAFDASGNLYAGGSFNTAGETSATRIAKWNGSAWSALGSGMNAIVYALAVDTSGNLYAGGDFTMVGGMTTNYIAKWNGSAWSALGTGMDSSVRALAFDASGNLYAGGIFTTAGGISASRIAKWDGSTWSALGSGINGGVKTVAFDASGNLYAGGGFTTAGGTPANYIAKWNGSAWSALGSGMSSDVNALVVDASGNLYAGGGFFLAGGTLIRGVAKWNGSAWSALGTGMGGSYSVDALALDTSGNLYAGGFLFTAGGTPANYIAKWNGSAWSALGSGTNATVRVLTVDASGNLYAGGDFTAAGGTSANCIAKWDGSAWSALGTGMDSTVKALARDSSGHLFVGGDFLFAGTTVSPYIAQANLNGSAVPTVTTPTSASITASGATLGGDVTSDGGAIITERGVVYSLTAVNSDPLINGTGVTNVTATGTTGVFTAAISGLAASSGYSFKAYATNAQGTSYTTVATFTTLAPPNAAPTDITLSSASLAENNAPGATVGTLTATDADVGDTHTFALASGAGSTDNGAFSISGNTLTINAAADFETQNTYAIRIRATDNGAGSLTFEKQFIIAISDVTLPQTITFGALANKTFGDAAFNVSATGGASGNAVTFSILSGPATISGNTVTITGAGGVTVRASQAGAGDYSAATPVDRTFIVAKAAQAITFNLTATAQAADSLTLNATGGASGNAVTFTVVGGPGVITGNTLTFGSQGNVAVRASQAGDGNYLPAPDVIRNVTVSLTPQTITFGALANKTYGAAPFDLSATGGGSSNPVTFIIWSGLASIAGNTVTITDAGNVTIRASQAGSALYAAAPDVFRTFTVAKAAQAISFTLPATAMATDTLTLSATGGGSSSPVTFSIVNGPGEITGNTLTFTGQFNVTVRASQAGNGPYLAAPDVFRTVSVSLVPQSITFGALANKTFGDAPFDLSATGGGSGNPVVLSIMTGQASIAGNTLTITGAGNVIVRAQQAGSALYAAAPEVIRSFTVAKAAQAISFTLPATAMATDTLTLSATGGGSSSPVTFSIVSGPGMVSGNTLSFTAGGSVVVRASQAGHLNYEAAPDVDRTIEITANNAPTDIALSATAIAENNAPGAAIGTLTATDADAGDMHSFTLVSGAGDADNAAFTITGDVLSLNGAADFESQGSYSIRIRATDDGTPAASYEEVFTITVVDVPEPPEIVVHDGAAISHPELTAGQTGVLVFGTTVTGTPIERHFLVENTGGEPLTVSAIQIDGVDLPVSPGATGGYSRLDTTTLPITIDPGESYDFHVQYNAVATGTSARTLRIVSNDADEANFDFQITASTVSATAAGRYAGALTVGSDVRGTSLITITTASKFSGVLMLSGRRYVINGTLTGGIGTAAAAGNPNIVATITTQAGPPPTVAVSVTDSSTGTTYTGTNDASSFNNGSPTPLAGTYTLALPPEAGTTPAGYGWARVRVTNFGAVVVTGRLADGSVFSTTSTLLPADQVPFYAAMPAGTPRASLSGTLAFQSLSASDLHGDLVWDKPAGANPLTNEPGPFTRTLSTFGSEFTRPAVGTPMLTLNGAGAATLEVSGGAAVPGTAAATIGGGAFYIIPAPGRNLRLAHQTGLIGGAYTAAPGVSRPFSGVVIQKQNKAFGYLLHGGQSSAVTLTPQP